MSAFLTYDVHQKVQEQYVMSIGSVLLIHGNSRQTTQYIADLVEDFEWRAMGTSRRHTYCSLYFR